MIVVLILLVFFSGASLVAGFYVARLRRQLAELEQLLARDWQCDDLELVWSGVSRDRSEAACALAVSIRRLAAQDPDEGDGGERACPDCGEMYDPRVGCRADECDYPPDISLDGKSLEEMRAENEQEEAERSSRIRNMCGWGLLTKARAFRQGVGWIVTLQNDIRDMKKAAREKQDEQGGEKET